MATNSHFRAAFLLGIACICASAFVVSPSPAAAPEFRMGTAAIVITPPKGTPMAGYFSERGSEGVLDDLYAKAAVLDDGKTKVAIVACDLIGLSRPVVTEARRIIAGRTGIPEDNVMI